MRLLITLRSLKNISPNISTHTQTHTLRERGKIKINGKGNCICGSGKKREKGGKKVRKWRFQGFGPHTTPRSLNTRGIRSLSLFLSFSFAFSPCLPLSLPLFLTPSLFHFLCHLLFLSSLSLSLHLSHFLLHSLSFSISISFSSSLLGVL